MWLILSFLRRRGADALAVLFILVCVTALAGPVVVHAALDRNGQCIYNVGRVITAFNLYMSDYDETIPYKLDYTTFQMVLTPYTRDTSVFRCPATQGSQYKVNTLLANQPLSSVANLDTTQVLGDSKPHPNGKLTIAYIDGHVEHGGVDQPLPLPDDTCYVHERRILNGIQLYAKDFNNTFPPQSVDKDFRQAVQPYVRSDRSWVCPDSKKFYFIGKDFRGKRIQDIPDLSPIIATDDPQLHRSGTKTTGYLDNYLEQRGPNGIIYPYLPSQSRLRLRNLTRAYAAYVQDHNGQLPVYSSYDALKPVLMPYLHASRNFETTGPKSFEVNLTLSGTLLSNYPDPKTVIVFRDPNTYGRPYITVGYLDGHLGIVLI